MVANEFSLSNERTLKGGAEGAVLAKIDQYELVRELGGGGFGTVYLAKDTTSGVNVAVKGLPPLIRNSREELENVKRNFALVAKLTHENIAKALVLHPAKDVTYLDNRAKTLLRVESGDTLMVMDFAPGVTLSQWRMQFEGGIVPMDKATDILAQVASALDYAHSQKIVHRDIKPSNVMIETADDGSVTARVLDFGLAAEIRSSLSRVSMQITDTSGTRPYMAPEQWEGRKQGATIDQYALAVMACELLTGEIPFKSAFDTGDPMVMMTAVTSRDPELGDGLPPKAAKAILRALSKKAEDRFASCEDFVSALCGRRVGTVPGLRFVGCVLVALVMLAVGVAGWFVFDGVVERRKAEERKLKIEAQKLKDAAVELKERARIAYEDAEKRKFADVPELSESYREFKRCYNSGLASFNSGDFSSATNFFTRVGSAMVKMAAEKRRLDAAAAARAAEEARRQRLAEVERKLALGYQRRKGEDGEDIAVWEEGIPHKSTAGLLTGNKEGTWVSNRPGYAWDGGTGVVWRSGTVHTQCSHWISGAKDETWVAEPGYVSADGSGKKLSPLVWKPDLVYGDFKTSNAEGGWEHKEKCDACGGNGKVQSTEICTVCNGARQTSVSRRCATCSGSGNVSFRTSCGSCSGSGSRTATCSDCNGGGRVRCGTCGGSGRVANVGGLIANAIFNRKGYSPPPPSQVPCGSCGGGGIRVCGSCSGNGTIRESCSACNGSGSVSSSKACIGCNGTGRIPGMETCRSCAGKGNVTKVSDCSSCTGRGFVWKSAQRPDDVFAMLESFVQPAEEKPVAEVKPTKKKSGPTGVVAVPDAVRAEKRFKKGLKMVGVDLDATFRNGTAIRVTPSEDWKKIIESAPEGAKVTFANGTYTCAGYVYLNKNLWIEGESVDGVILKDLQLDIANGLFVIAHISFSGGRNKYGVWSKDKALAVVTGCRFAGCGAKAVNVGKLVVFGTQIDRPSQWGICVSEGCRAYISDVNVSSVDNPIIAFKNSRIVVRHSELSSPNDMIYLRYDGSLFYIEDVKCKGAGNGITIGAKASGSVKRMTFEGCSTGIDNDGTIETYRNSFSGVRTNVSGRGNAVERDKEFGVHPELLK